MVTGLDAPTGSLLAVNIKGCGSVPLRDASAEGPSTFLGLMVHGFPNLFTITGPWKPVRAQQCRSIDRAARRLASRLHRASAPQRIARMEAALAAQDRWVHHVRQVADTTLYPTAASRYMGANIPG
ncbi:MAG: cyclohexanone monooxygenase, partial [Janthinobacterium lividum]